MINYIKTHTHTFVFVFFYYFPPSPIPYPLSPIPPCLFLRFFFVVARCPFFVFDKIFVFYFDLNTKEKRKMYITLFIGQMSNDGSAQFESIVSDKRTSYTDWCVDNCWEDEIIQNLVSRLENITRIPRQNSEFFQVLRYDVGQYYVYVCVRVYLHTHTHTHQVKA